MGTMLVPSLALAGDDLGGAALYVFVIFWVLPDVFLGVVSFFLARKFLVSFGISPWGLAVTVTILAFCAEWAMFAYHQPRFYH